MSSVFNEKKVLRDISTILQEKNESVAVAESVTAGLIQVKLSLGKDATLEINSDNVKSPAGSLTFLS